MWGALARQIAAFVLTRRGKKIFAFVGAMLLCFLTAFLIDTRLYLTAGFTGLLAAATLGAWIVQRQRQKQRDRDRKRREAADSHVFSSRHTDFIGRWARFAPASAGASFAHPTRQPNLPRLHQIARGRKLREGALIAAHLRVRRRPSASGTSLRARRGAANRTPALARRNCDTAGSIPLPQAPGAVDSGLNSPDALDPHAPK